MDRRGKVSCSIQNWRHCDTKAVGCSACKHSSFVVVSTTSKERSVYAGRKFATETQGGSKASRLPQLFQVRRSTSAVQLTSSLQPPRISTKLSNSSIAIPTSRNGPTNNPNSLHLPPPSPRTPHTLHHHPLAHPTPETLSAIHHPTTPARHNRQALRATHGIANPTSRGPRTVRTGATDVYCAD
jgi:hypothetical protein